MTSVNAIDEWADWDAAERDAQWSAYEAEYRPEIEAEARERLEAARGWASPEARAAAIADLERYAERCERIGSDAALDFAAGVREQLAELTGDADGM